MTPLGVFIATLLGYAVLSRWFVRLSVTPQIALLLAGLATALVLAGDVMPAIDAEILRLVGEVALVMALFVDASRSNIAALRRSATLPVRLLVVGLPLTIALGWVAAAVLVPGLDPTGAFILAVLVAPTDAALGALVVNSERVPLRIRQALNVESGLNDGLVTPLVLVGVAALAAEGPMGSSGWILDAVLDVALGAGAGILVGAGGGLLLALASRRDLIVPSTRWLIAPVLAMLAWVVANAIGGNAFVAAFVAGLSLTVVHGPIREAYLEFAEGFGELAGLAVFFLLGALLTQLPIGNPGIIAFALVALTLVRMLPVAVALVRSRLGWPTIAFVGWFGPRGLATVVLGLMAIGDGFPFYEGTPLAAAAGLTVALSVIAHGLSAGPLVAWYGRWAERLPEDAPELGRTIEIATRGAPLREGRSATDGSARSIQR